MTHEPDRKPPEHDEDATNAGRSAEAPAEGGDDTPDGDGGSPDA